MASRAENKLRTLSSIDVRKLMGTPKKDKAKKPFFILDNKATHNPADKSNQRLRKVIPGKPGEEKQIKPATKREADAAGKKATRNLNMKKGTPEPSLDEKDGSPFADVARKLKLEYAGKHPRDYRMMHNVAFAYGGNNAKLEDVTNELTKHGYKPHELKGEEVTDDASTPGGPYMRRTYSSDKDKSAHHLEVKYRKDSPRKVKGKPTPEPTHRVFEVNFHKRNIVSPQLADEAMGARERMSHIQNHMRALHQMLKDGRHESATKKVGFMLNEYWPKKEKPAPKTKPTKPATEKK